MDVDDSGCIELVELLVHIDLERTKFTERIFSIFDEDGSGQIDFREFVLSLWNYCTLSNATLGTYIYICIHTYLTKISNYVFMHGCGSVVCLRFV